MNKKYFLLTALLLTAMTAQAQVVGQSFFSLFVPGKTVNKSAEAVLVSKLASDGNTLLLEYFPHEPVPSGLDFYAMADIRCEISTTNIIFITMDKNYNIKEIGLAGGDASAETTKAVATWAVNELIAFPGFEKLRVALKLDKISSKAEMDALLQKIKVLQNKDKMTRPDENGILPPPLPPLPPMPGG
jgi:hypothetical protein